MNGRKEREGREGCREKAKTGGPRRRKIFVCEGRPGGGKLKRGTIASPTERNARQNALCKMRSSTRRANAADREYGS